MSLLNSENPNSTRE